MAQDKTDIYTYAHTHAGEELAVMGKQPVPPVPPVPVFSDWLLAYRRKNRIGDLAADVRRDPPPGQWGYVGLLSHLQDRRACVDAWNSAKAAKSAYDRYVAKSTSSE